MIGFHAGNSRDLSVDREGEPDHRCLDAILSIDYALGYVHNPCQIPRLGTYDSKFFQAKCVECG